jgi:hypothetical protein
MTNKYEPMVWYSNSTLHGTNIHQLIQDNTLETSEMLKIVGDIPSTKSFFYFISNNKVYIITN